MRVSTAWGVAPSSVSFTRSKVSIAARASGSGSIRRPLFETDYRHLHIGESQVVVFSQVTSNGLSFFCGLAGRFKLVQREQSVYESLENVTAATPVAGLLYDLQGRCISAERLRVHLTRSAGSPGC